MDKNLEGVWIHREWNFVMEVVKHHKEFLLVEIQSHLALGAEIPVYIAPAKDWEKYYRKVH